MAIEIPDDILLATHMTPAELLQEIALALFEKEKLTLAQAARLAKMSRMEFQHLLASRKIPVHYDVADFEADLESLQERERS